MSASCFLDILVYSRLRHLSVAGKMSFRVRVGVTSRDTSGFHVHEDRAFKDRALKHSLHHLCRMNLCWYGHFTLVPFIPFKPATSGDCLKLTSQWSCSTRIP